MPTFALIELVLEILIEIILEVVFELLIELLWFVTRQTGQAGMYAARVSRLVDAAVYTLIAAGAWFWGNYLANSLSEPFPWSITWLIALTSFTSVAATGEGSVTLDVASVTQIRHSPVHTDRDRQRSSSPHHDRWLSLRLR